MSADWQLVAALACLAGAWTLIAVEIALWWRDRRRRR